MPLARYAKLVRYNEASFFGFSIENTNRTACREIWTQDQRDELEFYLKEAQEELEEVIEYPLEYKWFANERHPLTSTRSLVTSKGKIIEAGIRAVEVISDDAVVDYSIYISDPDIAQVELSVNYSGKSIYDLHVFYPDTDKEINPSNIVYDSLTQTLTIYIPKPRLLQYDLLDNTEEGYLYSDPANFQLTVDVHRIYNDSSVQGRLMYRGDICDDFCTEGYDAVCIYVKNPEIGSVQLAYPTSSSCKYYEAVEVNYRAGILCADKRAEMTLMRLAHSKMPGEPCGCETVQRLWLRDRELPTYMTRERLDCPFGLSNGAWISYRWACGMQLMRGSALI